LRFPWNTAAADLHQVRAPIAIFFGAYWLSRAFRAFVLRLDLRLVTAIQAWRFAGLGFIALYTYGVLPGMFAWPAGLGDIAIGLTAPWVMQALQRRPEFAASNWFVAWNCSESGPAQRYWHGNGEFAPRSGYGRRSYNHRWRSCRSCWYRRFRPDLDAACRGAARARRLAMSGAGLIRQRPD
jgi:hypothetical protein